MRVTLKPFTFAALGSLRTWGFVPLVTSNPAGTAKVALAGEKP